MLAAPDGELRVMTSSSEAMRVVELFELQSQEGPCLDCYRTGRPVVNQDLATVNGRWPRFAAVAVSAGFRAADAIPMRLRGQVIGALNLFRTETGSLNDDDVPSPKPSPTSPPSPSSSTATPCDAHVVNDQLSRALEQPHRHRAGQGHDRRTGAVDMDQQRSPACEPTPATTTAASPTSPPTSSTAPSRSPHSTRQPPNPARTEGADPWRRRVAVSC